MCGGAKTVSGYSMDWVTQGLCLGARGKGHRQILAGRNYSAGMAHSLPRIHILAVFATKFSLCHLEKSWRL